jgi:molybdopterin molybdotransferase
MIDKAEARRVVIGEAAAGRRVEEVPLARAFGRVLARDARAEADLPPFEKSSMDGWAVRSADVAAPPATLRVLGAVHAGQVAPAPVGPGETWKIMTGAPLPAGADAVVMVEDSAPVDGGARVELRRAPRAWQNVCRKGEDARAGEVVLAAGTPLDAAALSLLATVGADPVATFAPPRVCVVPTGDELVEGGGAPPGPGRIRESNGVLLEAQIRQVSPAIEVSRPGIARDSRESLEKFLDLGCAHDVLVLSGGVSMGDLDLVGSELARRGLRALVEKVSIKPGKPLLFGWMPRAGGGRCAVFGLPGNPVSSFVTFELFVRPFLLRWLGQEDVEPDVVRATLDAERELKGIPRTQHVPARLSAGDDGRLRVRPLEWHGSADLRGFVDANAMIVIEPGPAGPKPGDLVTVERLASRGLRSSRPPSRPA